MKNILIFAGIAGIASAIAIYFVTEGNKKSNRGNSNYNIQSFDRGVNRDLADSF